MTASPCVNVCHMNPRHGLCVGCYRTLEEIARWSALDEPERAQIVVTLRERRAQLGPLRAPRPR